MTCRMTGFTMLAAGGVQEAADLAAVAHPDGHRDNVPVLNFFGGFRTSHEIRRSTSTTTRTWRSWWTDAIEAFRSAMPGEPTSSRARPRTRTSSSRPKEASQPTSSRVPDVVAVHAPGSKLHGRECHVPVLRRAGRGARRRRHRLQSLPGDGGRSWTG